MVTKPVNEVQGQASGVTVMTPFKQRDSVDIGLLLSFAFLRGRSIKGVDEELVGSFVKNISEKGQREECKQGLDIFDAFLNDAVTFIDILESEKMVVIIVYKICCEDQLGRKTSLTLPASLGLPKTYKVWK